MAIIESELQILILNFNVLQCFNFLLITFSYSLKSTLTNSKNVLLELIFNTFKLVFKNISVKAFAVFIKCIFIARTRKRATTTIVS